MKGKTAKGHVVKHTKKATAKHHSAKAKHHPTHHAKAATHHKAKVHAKAKHPAHAKAVGLALSPGDAACCGAEALAASLRLGGLSVPDAEILSLFCRAGGHPDKGIPIGELLAAASEYGLAGVRPTSYYPYARDDADSTAIHVLGGDGRDVAPLAVEAGAFPPVEREPVLHRPVGHADHIGTVHVTSLILGLDLPGAHAVLATPEGWWSWGELYCPWCEFPDAVIEQAWAVSWAVAE